MTHPLNIAAYAVETAFLALQAFIVVFLLLHDWVPLGRWNNAAAKRHEDTLFHLVWTTLLAAVPSSIGLYYSASYFGRAYPHWLEMWLWITYGLFLLGMLRAWWIPYLLVPDAKRAARYQSIFANTYSFLPRHNGIAPDALHFLFHLTVVATLIGLGFRDHLIARMF
jgi:hypothetical protein